MTKPIGLYRFARPLLFSLPAETAHRVTLRTLSLMPIGFRDPPTANPVDCFGLKFPNRVGLAAGVDKDGEAIAAWFALGFGFVELGTVTPRAQPGNARPRLFRLRRHHAIINRMGFNNHGADALVERVRRFRASAPAAVIGINIGKNLDTPLERAAEDYCDCLGRVYDTASYVTVNLSSPNTPGLRALQQGEELGSLLSALRDTRRQLEDASGVRKPLLVKLAPDLPEADIPGICEALLSFGVDGIIATNTTSARTGVEDHPLAAESGGLSGLPLSPLASRTLRRLHRACEGKVPLVAAGGLFSGTDAASRIADGASLVQLYTGLIYRGPGLVRETVDRLGRL